MSAASSVAVPTKFAPLVAAVSRNGNVTVEEGWGKGNLVLKVAGKIFAILSEGRLVVKLPKARVDEMVEGGEGERFDPRRNGRVMKEWLVAGGSSHVTQLVRDAHAFVSGKSQAPARRVRASGGGSKPTRRRPSKVP
jgi:hypothetical protein